MKNLRDLVPIQLTNSKQKYEWLDKMVKSAATNDGKVIVAAIAVLIDEVIKLQESIGELRDNH
jgi:hypothetical protein